MAIKKHVIYVGDPNEEGFKKSYPYLVVASQLPGYSAASIVPITDQKPGVDRLHAAKGTPDDALSAALNHLDDWHPDCERIVDDR